MGFFFFFISFFFLLRFCGLIVAESYSYPLGVKGNILSFITTHLALPSDASHNLYPSTQLISLDTRRSTLILFRYANLPPPPPPPPPLHPSTTILAPCRLVEQMPKTISIGRRLRCTFGCAHDQTIRRFPLGFHTIVLHVRRDR